MKKVPSFTSTVSTVYSRRLMTQQRLHTRSARRSVLHHRKKEWKAWVAFYVKYHPEMNFIQYYWGYAKKNVKKHCDYTFEGLMKNVSNFLDEMPFTIYSKSSTQTIQLYSRLQWKFERTASRIWSIKYTSHRTIPAKFFKIFYFIKFIV